MSRRSVFSFKKQASLPSSFPEDTHTNEGKEGGMRAVLRRSLMSRKESIDDVDESSTKHEVSNLKQENDELELSLRQERSRYRRLHDEYVEQQRQIDNSRKIEQEIRANRKAFLAELSSSSPLKQENDELHQTAHASEQEEAAQWFTLMEDKIWIRRLSETSAELRDHIKRIEVAEHTIESTQGEQSKINEQIQQENAELKRAVSEAAQEHARYQQIILEEKNKLRPLHEEVAELQKRANEFENVELARMPSKEDDQPKHAINDLRCENSILQRKLCECTMEETEQLQAAIDQTEEQLTVETLRQRIACLSRNNEYQQSVIRRLVHEKEEQCSQISTLEQERAEQRGLPEGCRRDLLLDERFNMKERRSDHQQVVSPGRLVFSPKAPEISTPRSESSTTMNSLTSAPPHLAGCLTVSSNPSALHSLPVRSSTAHSDKPKSRRSIEEIQADFIRRLEPYDENMRKRAAETLGKLGENRDQADFINTLEHELSKLPAERVYQALQQRRLDFGGRPRQEKHEWRRLNEEDAIRCRTCGSVETIGAEDMDLQDWLLVGVQQGRICRSCGSAQH